MEVLLIMRDFWVGVGQDYSFDVIFSNSLSPGGIVLGKWVSS